MTTVIRLVNYLKASSALQHHTLRTFLTEVSGTFDDLLLHNRWLSEDRELERENVGPLAQSFKPVCLGKRLRKPKSLWISGKMKRKWLLVAVAFVTDIISHLSDLNVKLHVCRVCFSEVAEGVYTWHTGGQAALSKTGNLIEIFQICFEDFSMGKQVLPGIENPFLVRNVTEF